MILNELFSVIDNEYVVIKMERKMLVHGYYKRVQNDISKHMKFKVKKIYLRKDTIGKFFRKEDVYLEIVLEKDEYI